ncbi:inositol-1-monophosphatase [Candidatus Pantoea edessiphila]|uniref:Inositol-1-monophosphatase n=1 Tax=Candidatus Pantoea edessiphila TaxID=2044610 RepID=A0A2P5T147_9GAMM|nr:inositol-1-monophosphatase [Candidatus Pantoea edessiphila]PPI88311.1 inositol-1-monophosphatase [Candidatus Pantoea edessiphila]
MHPMLNIATRAARKAGNLIIKNYEIIGSIKINNTNNKNIMNAIKITLENLMIDVIHKAYPQHTILTKIHDNIVGKNRDIKWIIEPIDSIHNFIKRLPHFAISITLIVKDRAEVAVIYAPILNELFSAIRGQGAQLNGYRLRSNNAFDLQRIILAVGTLFSKQEDNQEYIRKINRIFNQKHIDFRRTGSVGLDMAYVAAGRVDAYCDIGLKPWNFDAGALLVRESGGLITDFSGNDNYKDSKNIIAANPYILKELLLNMRKYQ